MSVTEKAQHTPGPWQVTRAKNQHWSPEQGDGKTHPSVNGWRRGTHQYAISPETEEANARLIAAAPALLAAVQAALTPLIRLGDFIGNEDEGGASGLGPFDRCAIIRQVLDAITQAKGTP